MVIAKDNRDGIEIVAIAVYSGQEQGDEPYVERYESVEATKANQPRYGGTLIIDLKTGDVWRRRYENRNDPQNDWEIQSPDEDDDY